MKNINTILLSICIIAIAVLFYLHFTDCQGCTTTTPNTVNGETASKVAFINTDTFFKKYEVYQKLEKELEAENKASQTSLQNKMKSIETEYMNLVQSAQTGKITPEKAQAQEKQLVARKQALENEGQALMKKIQDKGIKADDELRAKLKEYFNAKKKDMTLDFVIGYQTSGSIFYVDSTLDITSKVLDELNK